MYSELWLVDRIDVLELFHVDSEANECIMMAYSRGVCIEFEGSILSGEKPLTFSLRLSETWKRRLERTAEHKDVSVNQLIMDIIAQHYESNGLFDTSEIVLQGGRQLELLVEKDNHPPGVPTCKFFLYDSKRNCEVACYQIGASNQLLRQFGINTDNEYEVVTELGKALLHHHNAHGLNITRLEWKQLPTIPGCRILDFNDLKTIDGQYLSSQESFHTALHQPNKWQDRHLKPILKPILTKSIANYLQRQAQQIYDDHIESLAYPDEVAVAQLIKERDDVVKLLGNLNPLGLEKLGLEDSRLNDAEVHIFSERWKHGHPELDNNRVVREIGSGTVDAAISNFVYGEVHFFLDSGQPYVCRWIDKEGKQRQRQLIAP